MFGSLIRRRPGGGAEGGPSDPAFESTTVSLSTAVPRPIERRTDERVSAMLRIAKLSCSTGDQLIKVKNLSAGGLMGYVNHPPGVGEQVGVELSSQKIPATVVWTRGDV